MKWQHCGLALTCLMALLAGPAAAQERAGTPAPIVDKLAREVTQIMANPDALEKSQRTGSDPMTMSPAEFTAFMRREAERWAKVLGELGLRYD
jgi:tripartite-type tricarboxylate transporter receptor subunit TctC